MAPCPLLPAGLFCISACHDVDRTPHLGERHRAPAVEHDVPRVYHAGQRCREQTVAVRNPAAVVLVVPVDGRKLRGTRRPPAARSGRSFEARSMACRLECGDRGGSEDWRAQRRCRSACRSIRVGQLRVRERDSSSWLTMTYELARALPVSESISLGGIRDSGGRTRQYLETHPTPLASHPPEWVGRSVVAHHCRQKSSDPGQHTCEPRCRLDANRVQTRPRPMAGAGIRDRCRTAFAGALIVIGPPLVAQEPARVTASEALNSEVGPYRIHPEPI